MMKLKPLRIKYLLLIPVFLFCFKSEASAQYLENEPTPTQRIFWGGNIGLMFGNYTYVSVDPIVGYRLTNRLSAGIGISYTWSRSNTYNISNQTYGGNVFASYTLIKDIGEFLPFNDNGAILAYGELAYLNISDFYPSLVPGASIWYHTPLAGIAYQTPIGNRSYMLLMFLYNFNESSLSPYSNPVIKACFQF